jgi:hypothetical protein
MPSDTIDPVKTMKDSIKNMKKGAIVGMLICLISILGFMLIWMFYSMSTKEETTCKTFNALYNKVNGKISSLYTSKIIDEFTYMFRDYYIKTAYNCCSTGDYKNGIVSTCALKGVLKQGVRGLDFEIYSIGDEPVVATSTESNNYVKETLNSVKFSDVMTMLTSYAFSSGSVPNPLDPLVIHLRFKSTNVAMYTNLAKIFKSHTNRLLDPKFGKENNYENFGKVPLQVMMGKIVIIVSNKNRTFADVPSVFGYVNMTSGSIFMRQLSIDEVVNNPNTQELVEYNRRQMTICTPNDKEMSPPNPSSVLCRNLGIQMVAVRYQESDVNFEEQTFYFNKENHAFVLKPAKFRYIQKCIPLPKKQDPALSFAPRKMPGPLGSNYKI